MIKKVTIIDYGLGNLFSVVKAFEHVEAEVEVTSDTKKILSAQRLVLPGVGAFNKGMAELHSRELVEPIRQYAAANKPLIGICLGMQMMFEFGEENGTHEGLGIIKGKVVKIPAKKIPNIGWAKLQAMQSWAAGSDKEFYFVHSYHAVCSDKNNLLATIEYEGNNLTAAVINNNIIGYQFHPEKSRSQGLDLFKEFLEM